MPNHLVGLAVLSALTGFSMSAHAQIGGSGKPGSLAVWTGSSTLGSSNLFQNRANLGVNNRSPRAQLDVLAHSGVEAIDARGSSGPGGSEVSGAAGLRSVGGDADPDSFATAGGIGVIGIGGAGSQLAPGAGDGGYFQGGQNGGGDGVFATCSKPCFAGNFKGDVNVTGTLTAATKNFRIDDPIDPAHRYLQHAAVESSEMKNIYDGTTVLNAQGAATVSLPAWFEAENRDFRYQLTALGSPSPGLYVARKVSANHFTIAGGAAGGEVSWQITGVRHDVFASANPLVVEPVKSASDQGRYLHPELYGLGAGQAAGLTRGEVAYAAPVRPATREVGP